jgi:hypothetical protein
MSDSINFLNMMADLVVSLERSSIVQNVGEGEGSTQPEHMMLITVKSTCVMFA